MKMIWQFLITGGHPYKMSEKRGDIERIALKYGTSPDYVYYLALGETYGSRKYDEQIKQELARSGIEQHSNKAFKLL